MHELLRKDGASGVRPEHLLRAQPAGRDISCETRHVQREDLAGLSGRVMVGEAKDVLRQRRGQVGR